MARPARACGALLCGLLLAGCAGGQSGFQQAASNAGAELEAAATTVEYAHMGRLPVAYARASFDGYRSSLRGTEEQLRTADGAPRGARLDRLLDLYRRGWQAVQQPCLDGACDWPEQVRALRAAGDALDREAGT